MSSLSNQTQYPQTPVSHNMIAIMTLLLLAVVAISTTCVEAVGGPMLAWFVCVLQVCAVLALIVYVGRHNQRAASIHRTDLHLQALIEERRRQK